MTWYVYVPIHELLHALGCVASGGSVTALEIQVQYGGALLARVFPFIVAGGEYAGRLSGFDPHGSDLVYLATDALPYSLSVLLGVPLLRACALSRRPFSTGAGVVVGLAPFYNLPGDYYEMGSIVATRMASWLGGSFEGLRSDDLVLLVGQLFSQPAELGLEGRGIALPLLVVTGSLAVGLALAFATWWLGDRVARMCVGPSPGRAARVPRTPPGHPGESAASADAPERRSALEEDQASDRE